MSHSCLLFSLSKLTNPWQNLLISHSSNGWEPARIVSHHKACVGPLLRLGIYCIPSHSCQCHGRALTSNIFIQQVLIFFWCQSGLLLDCCDAYWWVLSRWFPERRINPGGAGHLWYPASPWLVVLLWVFAPIYPCSIASVVSILYCQCWPCKNFWRLALFVGHPKNSGAEIRRRSHKWELSASVIGKRMENWALLSWHWSVNFANDKRFGHSQFETYLPYPGFSAKILTKHLQLHLLYPSGSQFENGLERALGPIGLVWSSNSSYPWSNKGCYGLWGQAPCAYNLLNSYAMFWKLWR